MVRDRTVVQRFYTFFLKQASFRKEGVEEDVFNYAIVYDRNNREQLLYESCRQHKRQS